jgi:hypothetical protein
MAKMTKEQCADIFGSDAEPTTTAYDIRIVVCKDGRGGVCRYESNEVNDVVTELVAFVQNDAPPVKIIDLRTRTGV